MITAMFPILLKTIHVSTVVISITLFTLRCIWVNSDSPVRNMRWVKVVPHVNDTVLLVSALALAASYGQYPFVNHWLTVKVIALLLYIGTGMVALKYGRTPGVRKLAWVIATCIFAYIVSVAITKNPAGPF